MRYFSTKRNSPHVTFRKAVELGQPPDKGLYYPFEIPRLPDNFLAAMRERTNGEILFEMMRSYVGGEIPDDDLLEICVESVDFPFPLFEITPQIYALELFHGPTLAFKDVGARFMSRCLRYFSTNRKSMVIVATSGDTGSAVAAGFEGVEGIEVVILYPKGGVSAFQEGQLTALRPNVTTLELRGSFDQCQGLAKQALADPELQSSAFITSANSINIARWLPQQCYYAFALKSWEGTAPVFSVPSGNFGNISAGMLARASGLPIKSFIAACNANDTVPRFMLSGEFEPEPSKATLSNAMDVGDPSNFPRLLEICGHDLARLKSYVTAVSVSDDETAETMRDVHADRGYVLDPHGAVGYRALADFLTREPDSRGIFLETAHPVKFDAVQRIIGNYGVVPEASVAPSEESQKIEIEADYGQVRAILQSKIRA